jgi:AICAR transformylase/IMP cyclohydrolase PurH
LLTYQPGDGPLGCKVLHGKALSYNNLSIWMLLAAAASFEQIRW